MFNCFLKKLKLNQVSKSLNKQLFRFSTDESKIDSSLVNPSSPKKIFKIIPIQINECLMPYGKTIRVQNNDSLKKILNNTKPFNSEYCVFFYDRKKIKHLELE